MMTQFHAEHKVGVTAEPVALLANEHYKTVRFGSKQRHRAKSAARHRLWGHQIKHWSSDYIRPSQSGSCVRCSLNTVMDGKLSWFNHQYKVWELSWKGSALLVKSQRCKSQLQLPDCTAVRNTQSQSFKLCCCATGGGWSSHWKKSEISFWFLINFRSFLQLWFTPESSDEAFWICSDFTAQQLLRLMGTVVFRAKKLTKILKSSSYIPSKCAICQTYSLTQVLNWGSADPCWFMLVLLRVNENV